MIIQYKTIDVTTTKGHQQAAALQSKGWRVVHGSLYGAVLLEKSN